MQPSTRSALAALDRDLTPAPAAAARRRGGASRALLIVALALGVVTADAWIDSGTADARPRPAGRHRKSNFEANKTFGLGLMLGAPTGLSGKYFVGRSNAIDFGIGTIYGYRGRHGLHVHADYLWHPLSLTSAPAFELPLYIGIGGRFYNGDRCYLYANNGKCDYYYNGYTAVGVRAPIGISFDFNNVPIDIFGEIAFVFDFLVDHDSRYDNGVYFDVNGAIGLRYYFN
ncbi:MAG: DUF3996 domain-containing protein [Kofleriaceae bacterium]|nr:DUF3996 domain-containing protein [Kofleriaceae bacterium]